MTLRMFDRLFGGRILMTRRTVVQEVIPFFLIHYALAVLVLLPRTRMFRVALFPLMFGLTVHATFSWDRSNGNPRKAYENMTLFAYNSGILMRSTIWTFRRKPYQRKGRPSNTLGNLLLNGADLFFNPRGVGWDWAHEEHFPKPVVSPELPLPVYTIKTMAKWMACMAIFDVFVYTCQSFDFSTIGSPSGGTIFDPDLPPLLRYSRSTAFTVLFGLFTLSSLANMHQTFRLIFIVVFGHKQSQWPHLFDNPIFSTSLADLWGRRWHQLLRQSFLVFGGQPLAYITRTGRAGSVLGSFILSGVIHYVGYIQSSPIPQDLRAILLFFTMMGIGVLLEGFWKKVTGSKVTGFLGWVWVVVWVVGWGNLYADAVARTGYLGNEFVPDGYRLGPYVFEAAGFLKRL